MFIDFQTVLGEFLVQILLKLIEQKSVTLLMAAIISALHLQALIGQMNLIIRVF